MTEEEWDDLLDGAVVTFGEGPPRPRQTQAERNLLIKKILDIQYEMRKERVIKEYAEEHGICPIVLKYGVEAEIIRQKQEEKRKKDAILARMKAHRKP